MDHNFKYTAEEYFSKMDSVILIRHGQSTVNIQKVVSSDNEGYPLTETGVIQTESISSQLSGISVDGIFSSPVLRTRQTSQIISRAIGIEYQVDDRIRESGLGRYNNFKISSLPKLSHRELGMELWESHIERFLSLIREKKGRNMLVSHAYPIRAILSHYIDLSEEESNGVRIGNATASVIDIENGKVLCIGSRKLSERVLKFLRT